MSFCEENEEKWGPFLAGEVESEERARLEEHLESCQQSADIGGNG